MLVSVAAGAGLGSGSGSGSTAGIEGVVDGKVDHAGPGVDEDEAGSKSLILGGA